MSNVLSPLENRGSLSVQGGCNVRKLSGLIILLLLSVVLVACGAEDEEDPTPEPTAAVESAPTTDADVGLPGTPAIVEDDDATPDAGVAADASPAAATPAVTDRATAIAAVSTPVVVVTDQATPVASPVMDATPVIANMASPVATPRISESPGATPEATPDNAASAQPALIVPGAADATEAPVVMIELSGMVVLNGVENETYILTNEGCVGLGQHNDLREGRQVVVRDETGTIVSVTELGASDENDRCAWDFVVQVPESTFYSVSIPMKFEHVFPNAQVSENGGEVVIELP
jgi:hypothetical protein